MTPIPNPLPDHKDREKLNLTADQACTILDGDDPLYETISNEICDRSRWMIHYYLIVKRLSDGRFFADSYSLGATESQENDLWESNEPDFTEVFPKEVTTVEFV